MRRLPDQAAQVISRTPDVVCLQEVIGGAVAGWRQVLAYAGLEYVAVGEPGHGSPARPLRVLTAAREPLETVPVAGLPWPERVLAVKLAVSGVEVVNVHSPISQRPDLVKVITHEAVDAFVRGAAPGPRLICGDLNTPRKEHPDGRVWTFARGRNGRFQEGRGERWDAAELALLKGLEPLGYRDAFRELHRPEVQEPSWEWPRTGGGYRLDHLIVSAEIALHDMEYRHEWRRDGLSDHSGFVADVGIVELGR